jgi:hypothetical protein
MKVRGKAKISKATEDRKEHGDYKNSKKKGTETEIKSDDDDDEESKELEGDEFLESINSVYKSIAEITPSMDNIINLVLSNGMGKQIDTYLIMTLIQKYGIYGMLKIKVSKLQFRSNPIIFYFYIATVITFLLINQTPEARNEFTKNSIRFLSQVGKDHIPLLLNATIQNVHQNEALVQEILFSLLLDTESHCCYKSTMFKSSKNIKDITNILSCLTKAQVNCSNLKDEKDAWIMSNGGYKGEINMSFADFDSKTEFSVIIYVNKFQYSLGNYSVTPLAISKDIAQQTIENIFQLNPFEGGNCNHYRDGYFGGDYDLRYLMQLSYDYEDYKIDKDRVLDELENYTNFGNGKTQKWEHTNQYDDIVNKAKQYVASYDPEPPYIITQSPALANNVAFTGGPCHPIRSANPKNKI